MKVDVQYTPPGHGASARGFAPLKTTDSQANFQERQSDFQADEHQASSGGGSGRGRGGALAGCEDPPAFGERCKHRELFLAPGRVGVAHAAWLANISAWRAACREAVGYAGGLYDVEALKWVRTSFSQPQTRMLNTGGP